MGELLKWVNIIYQRSLGWCFFGMWSATCHFLERGHHGDTMKIAPHPHQRRVMLHDGLEMHMVSLPQSRFSISSSNDLKGSIPKMAITGHSESFGTISCPWRQQQAVRSELRAAIGRLEAWRASPTTGWSSSRPQGSWQSHTYLALFKQLCTYWTPWTYMKCMICMLKNIQAPKSIQICQNT